MPQDWSSNMNYVTMFLMLATTTTTLVAAAAEGTSSSAAAAAEAHQSQLNRYLGHDNLFALLGFTAVVLIHRMVTYIMQYIRTLACLGNDSQRYFTIPNPSWAMVKSKLLYAPLLRVRHNREFRLSSAVNMGILPTRFQATFLCTVLAANVALCVYGIPWSDPEKQVLPILRNRTGTISVANLIPIMIMGSPANPLIPWVDVSYDSFNMMHRWFGRFSVLQAIAHTICWMIATVQKGGWSAVGKAFTHSHLIMTGLVATCTLVMILFQSSSAVRHAFYEVFHLFHIALVILVLVFLWMHLDGLPQQVLLLVAIIVWGVQRSSRLFCLLKCNFGRGGTKAIIESLPGDAVRISFISPRPWRVQPGQYMYVSFPSMGLVTAHPFSVAWSDTTSGRPMSSELDFGDKPLHRPLDLENPGKQTLCTVIRRRTGFTNALYEKAEKEGAFEGATTTLSAYIEGPYGNCRSMSSYGTVMLFAGGVGITHQMPYVRQLVDGYANGTVAARKVVLVWIIQSPEHLEWIRPWMTQILSMEKRRDVLCIKLFITRPRSAKEVHSPSSTVQMFPGRPSVATLIGKECENMIGCMGVSVCGTGELQDDVRKVVREKGAWANIDFIEESFSW